MKTHGPDLLDSLREGVRLAGIGGALASALMIAPAGAQSAEGGISQTPLFLSQAVNPQVMLNLSNDAQLYFKAYDDYSDLTGDGQAETTYQHDFDYYGYFDPEKCYAYEDDVFVPKYESDDKYCDSSSGQWSGNFMNWVSMARVDTVRKILYGGFRSTDTADRTVLERTYLPNDAHSWAKYYNGSDIGRLTPFGSSDGTEGDDDKDSQSDGITFCNTTRVTDGSYSQDVTDPPLIRVAKGNYTLWAANERWQCQWYEEQNNTLSGFNLPGGEPQSGSNGNIPAVSGLEADSDNPRQNSAGLGEFIARIEACVDGLEGTERCKRYPDGNLKPVGLLQIYGDDDLIDFGLMTGSYARNKSGGVLRKNVSSFRNEVNTDTDGTFQEAPATGGIIAALDAFRLFGYRHSDGVYTQSGPDGDNCPFSTSSFNDGRCSNWGNPQSEIFLESLRYFAGQSATGTFDADDSSRITGLFTAEWEDPLSNDNHCAPLNVIQFNASSSSYDGDQLGGSGDIGLANVQSATDLIGSGEGIHGNTWFVGESGGDDDQLCTPKSISSLGSVAGTCPDAPRLEGSYNIAGLAYHAWTEGVRTDLEGDQFVRTYGVALAPAVPEVSIPIPGDDGQRIIILPACRNTNVNPNGNCAVVDFKIVAQDIEAGTGQFYVNWEDIEQGGDFDSDMWGILSYRIAGNQIEVTTNVVATSTSQDLGFGYVISGTSDGDGFRVHSGSQGFTYTDPDGFLDCSMSGGCTAAQSPTTETYSIGGGSANLLERPLFYATKWGGFDKTGGATTPAEEASWDASGDRLPDNYFFAVDPGELENSLNEAFLGVLQTSASAASVATNSTRLDADTAIYQARFDSENWSGELLAFPITATGEVAGTPLWNAATLLDDQSPGARQIFSSSNPATTDGATVYEDGIEFAWNDLSDAQRTALEQGLTADEISDGLGESRLQFLRGDRSQERTTTDQALPFRSRDSVLGDIVNSNPQFVGTQDFGYGILGPNDDFDDEVGADYQTYRSNYSDRTPMVVVGANDGMLHAFDASDDSLTGGTELFAYVPADIYDNLYQLTLPEYTHRYYVDGTPRVADAWLGSGRGWRKVVAGTTGAGGRSVFMLDVTDPDTMSTDDVLWEFSHSDLGATIGQPAIVALETGQFGVVVSSGYNSGGDGTIFILDAETGEIIETLSTDEPTAGMGSPLVLDTTGNRIADRIYVGDMEGRLWRFDIDGNNWGLANFTGGGNTDGLLFTARNADGTPQPITAQPEAGRNPDGDIMIFFGTGAFYRNGDNIIDDDPSVQSFYGIVDQSGTINGRDSLTQQEIIGEIQDFGVQLRAVTDRALDEPDGWYLDLVSPENGAEGERVVQRAILRSGRIIFTTLVPSPNACDFGGTSWLMELNAFTGARIERPVFDLNEDGQFDSSDYVTVDPDTGEEVPIPPSGLQPDGSGILSPPAIISAGEREFKFLSGSTGVIENVTERGADGLGRQSWRQLR